MLIRDAVILSQEIEKLGTRLTRWEIDFLSHVRDWPWVSKEQEDCLINIYKRASGGGQYERREIHGGGK